VSEIRVVLVDDEPLLRHGLRMILEGAPGISVIGEAGNGKEGVELILAEEPDVVLMDIRMPVMDGIAATKRVVEAGGPPVLILTTYDTQADTLAAVEAGAMGYLLKDSPEQALHEAVLNTAAHRRTLAPEVVDLLAQRVGRPQESLSTRELEILRALSSGSSNKELAKQLFISEATVKTHLIHIFQKLGVETRTAAVTVARERKLI